MTFIRLHTGDDGNTHIEELDPKTSPQLTEQLAAQSIGFRAAEPGHFLDWHNAPRRQFVITLAGEYEIGLRDGSVHRFGAGHVTLAEDMTGSGHTTRVCGQRAARHGGSAAGLNSPEAQSLVLSLDEDRHSALGTRH